MKTNEFKEWLNEIYPNSPETVSSRLSNCNNIENYYGDLDKHLEKDNCSQLIFDLTYSTSDERNNIEKKHKIPINGNIRTGSATLKQALKLYISFNEDLDLNEPNISTFIYNNSSDDNINKIMRILDNFKFNKAYKDVKILQLSLLDYLNSNYSSYEWIEEYKPSLTVNDSIDIFGTSSISKFKIAIELDAHRADQVAKKFVSRMALLEDENIIYLALCYPATKKMSKNETLKYFKYCSIISKKISENSNSEKLFAGKIFNL